MFASVAVAIDSLVLGVVDFLMGVGSLGVSIELGWSGLEPD